MSNRKLKTYLRQSLGINDMEKRISDELQKIREELSNRVGVLEKWRWVIIGGSIVVGFIITKLPIWS